MRSILLYHNLANRISPFGSTIPPKLFEKHIKLLRSRGASFISMEEYLNGKEGVAITFDDGFEDLYYFLPGLVDKYKIKPLVFVVSGFLGKINTWDVWPGKGIRHLNISQLRELNELGVEIGSHSHTHIDFLRAGISEIERELSISKGFLEDVLGREVKFFSFPFGRWKNIAISKAIDCGFRCTFTSIPLKNRIAGLEGRWGVYIIDPPELLLYKCNDGLISRIEFAKLRAINFFSNGTYYVKSIRV